MKKLVSLLLLLTLCVCLLSTAAYAAGTIYSEGYFYYTVADNSITITGYFGNETEVTVPAMIAGVPVNAIAPGAFTGTSVQVIHLPDTIMAIGEGGTGTSTVLFPDEASQTDATQGQAPSGTASGGTTSGSTSDTVKESPVIVQETQGEASPTEENTAQNVNRTDEATVDEESDTTAIDTTVKERDGIVVATPEPSPSPEPTPEEEPPTEKSGSPLGWIIGAAVLVCGGATVIVIRKKGGKA